MLRWLIGPKNPVIRVTRAMAHLSVLVGLGEIDLRGHTLRGKVLFY